MNKRWMMAVFLVSLLLLAGCGGTTKFCEVVATADTQMDEGEVNDYYERLEAAAPAEIKDDVATLRAKWKQFSFPLSGGAGGEVSRPSEVSEAAENVANYIAEKCDVEPGVGIYLVFPEIGW